MKQQPTSVHRSMQGREIDMNKLMNQNEMTVAVGNARVNARGDELGPGGRIVKRREAVLREDSSSSTVPDQSNVRQPVTAVKSMSKTPALIQLAKKNTSTMDPEGKE